MNRQGTDKYKYWKFCRRLSRTMHGRDVCVLGAWICYGVSFWCVGIVTRVAEYQNSASSEKFEYRLS